MYKSLYGFVYFHNLLYKYHQVVFSTEICALAATGSDHVIHSDSTRQGAKVATNCIVSRTAKDRKAVSKSLKGHVRTGLLGSAQTLI
jgi:hypothetical protein